MFEEYFTEHFTLLNPAGVRDGEPIYSAVTCRGRTIGSGSQRKSPDDTPQDCQKTVLLSGSVPPLPGCKIRQNGTEYAIGSIQSCRNLDGEILCYRCTVL